jgi:hypothetical protein
VSEGVVDTATMLERAVDAALESMLPPALLQDKKAMATVKRQLAMKWVTQNEVSALVRGKGAVVMPPDPAGVYLARGLRIIECRVKQELDRGYYGGGYEGRMKSGVSSNRIEMTFDAGGVDFGGLVRGGVEYCDIVRSEW